MRRIHLIVCLVLVVVIYVFLAAQINKTIFKIAEYPYYNYLTNAFLHGRVNVVTNQIADLSLFNHRLYLYWGPAPILFILPFYLVKHMQTSDVFYTLIAGLLNVVMFLFLLKQFTKYYGLKLSSFSFIIVLLGFAFSSPNLFLSLYGNIWQTNQVIAVLYLLTFLYFYFRFLNTKRILFLVLALVFFNLAWLSRLTLIIYGLFFIYNLWISKKVRDFKKYFLLTISISALFICLFFTYNFIRFHNIVETGFRFQQAYGRYFQDTKAGRILDMKFFTHNVNYYLFNYASFSLTKPYVKYDPEGNSIISVYPLTLLLLFLIQKKHFKNKQKFFLIFASTISLLLFGSLLFYLSTGWSQFGLRYVFDVLPLLFLFIAIVIGDIPHFFLLFLFLYGVSINIIGILTFHKII